MPSQVKLLRLILDHSGKICINNNADCKNKTPTDALIEITINPYDSSENCLINIYEMKKWSMAIASNPPYNHKYCAMCKHLWHQNEIYSCQQTGEILDLCQQAYNCSDYEANIVVIDSWNQKFEKYKQKHPIEFKSNH